MCKLILILTSKKKCKILNHETETPNTRNLYQRKTLTTNINNFLSQ